MVLHVVGNVCVDISFRVRRLPHLGETLNAIAAHDGVGGKGANQAVAAARSGVEVRFWAALGNDVAGDWLVELLGNDLSTNDLIQLAAPTDRSAIMVDLAGENAIVSAVACAEAFDPLSQTDLIEKWRAGETLLMQGNLKPQATEDCLRHAQQAGLKTMFNPSPLPERGSTRLHQVDLVIVNRGEARTLTGFDEPEKALHALVKQGARSAIVTLGSDGCLILENAMAVPISLAAPKVATADTSGAGDCFAGALAGLIALGQPLIKAAGIATQAAAIAASRNGTLASYPSKEEFADLRKQSELESI